MSIRIPTGLVNVSLHGERKTFLEYQCPKCGRLIVQDYFLQTTQVATYHEFGGEKASLEAKIKVQQQVNDALDKLDAELYEAFNIRHDYSKNYSPIFCMNCGEKQPWSAIPKPWKQTAGFRFWAVGLFFTSLIVLVGFLEGGWFPFMFLPYPLILAALPLIRRHKRKKVLLSLQGMSFHPPKYYTRRNIHELQTSTGIFTPDFTEVN